MDDLISRQAAIDAVEVTDWYHQNRNGEMVKGANSQEHQAWYKAEDVYKALEDLSSAQQWIPCSERLPERNGYYLVTGRQGAVNKRLYQDGYWYGNWAIIAWMPLPEPWRGENNET